MKIQESTVQLQASHGFKQARTTAISFENNFREVFSSMATGEKSKAAEECERVATMLKNLVDAIMAAIEGKQCPEKLAAGDADLPTDKSTPAEAEGPRLQWRCQIENRYSESETARICGQGQVRTADGRQLDFSFSTELAREYVQNSVLTEAGSIQLKDPLILGFDGKAVELTERRIDFDLDADGCPERIPGLGQGCGYLVFDRNANGKVDDGKELFGALSGHGFADLAALDADGNGWIDESDPAFSQLSVWDGAEMHSMAARGIGALYGAAVDVPFALKNDENELLGQIRAAGFYLNESGQAGRIHQVDLAVSAPSSGDHQPDERQQLAA